MQLPDWNKNMKRCNTQCKAKSEVQKTVSKWCTLCGMFQCALRLGVVIYDMQSLAHWSRPTRRQQHMGAQVFHHASRE